MWYRAEGVDGISRIGYAVSVDGIRWNRLREPVLEPQGRLDVHGVEDPRVTELDGMFYMGFTAFGVNGQREDAWTPMFARSNNLITWDRIGPLVRGEDNKDHFLLPVKLGGNYIAFHRRPPSIWLAESDDLLHWPEELMRCILSPRPGSGWDSKRIGGNGPPIATEHGWLTLYHGYDEDHVYRIGVCLLDLENPGIVINRPQEPILEPEEEWELHGNVPNVVFSSANPVVERTVHVYYGAADRVIGLATASLDELIEFARFG
jgi:predicted GH43/DUF377 family glycosyl hydrolase